MQISHVPFFSDQYYYRTGEIEPRLENDILQLCNGRGEYRRLGTPQVDSYEILNTDDLTVILIVHNTKHSKGQFYRFYRPNAEGENWEQVSWTALSDPMRLRVLIACEDRAPTWARKPGKLRDQYITPTTNSRTSYKFLQVIDGRYFSVYARLGSQNYTEYTIGKRLVERATDDHTGGYYSYPDPVEMERRFWRKGLFPVHCYEHQMELVLVECEISGTIMENWMDDWMKYCSTYIRPMKVIKQFTYTPKEEKKGVA